jgi:hypothetical protein
LLAEIAGVDAEEHSKVIQHGTVLEPLPGLFSIKAVAT